MGVAVSAFGAYALVVVPSLTGATSHASSPTSARPLSVVARRAAVGSRGGFSAASATPAMAVRRVDHPTSARTTPSAHLTALRTTPGARVHTAVRSTEATSANVATVHPVTTTPVSRATPTSGRSTSPTTSATTRPVAATPAVAPVSGAAATLAAHLNPAVNIAPNPDFLQAGNCTQTGSTWTCDNPCLTSTLTWPAFTDGVACTNYVLQAIDNARAVEHLGPMTLPSNWYSLTTAQQLFVVANLERTARGLPPYLGINAALSAAAQRAAASNQDPGVAAGFAIATDAQGYPAMGGAWSGGFSVLAADYIWMYDDGWGGSAAATSNVACTTASAAGCWAHRDELLGNDPGYNPGVGLSASNCEMGVGFAVVGGSGSFVDLIEQPASTPPAMTFTWAADVVPYL